MTAKDGIMVLDSEEEGTSESEQSNTSDSEHENFEASDTDADESLEGS
jgi:hypothetical protein